MSTRSHIGIVNADESVDYIYCHNDGYPEHHIPILTKHYALPVTIRHMLSFGSMSILGERVGEKHDFDERCSLGGSVCTYYGRDRGEPNAAMRHVDTLGEFERLATNDFTYLFRDGQWWVRSWGGAWMTPTRMLAERAVE